MNLSDSRQLIGELKAEFSSKIQQLRSAQQYKIL